MDFYIDTIKYDKSIEYWYYDNVIFFWCSILWVNCYFMTKCNWDDTKYLQLEVQLSFIHFCHLSALLFCYLWLKLSRALIFIFIFIQWKQETYLHVYICNFYCILYILHICKHICNIYQSVVNNLIGESSSKRFWNSAQAILVIV